MLMSAALAGRSPIVVSAARCPWTWDRLLASKASGAQGGRLSYGLLMLHARPVDAVLLGVQVLAQLGV